MAAPFTVRFEDSPFMGSSTTGAHQNRLNWRARVLLEQNELAVRDRRVLDLASHDGRFSYACTQFGAESVTGVESRPHLVANAESNMRALEIEPHRCEFVCADVFDYLPTVEPGQFDTVLCMGFIYHTARQIELLAQLQRLRPRYLVLDARIHPNQAGSDAAALHFATEDPDKESCTSVADGVVAVPTLAFLELFCAQLGMEAELVDWKAQGIENWKKLKDYRDGRRVSLLARSR